MQLCCFGVPLAGCHVDRRPSQHGEVSILIDGRGKDIVPREALRFDRWGRRSFCSTFDVSPSDPVYDIVLMVSLRHHLRHFSESKEIRMSEEKRRAVFERVGERARKAGLKLEDDPEFLENVERWIVGEIDMPKLRGDYLRLLYKREDGAWIKAQIIKRKS
jgi:hypothetical protein